MCGARSPRRLKSNYIYSISHVRVVPRATGRSSYIMYSIIYGAYKYYEYGILYCTHMRCVSGVLYTFCLGWKSGRDVHCVCRVCCEFSDGRRDALFGETHSIRLLNRFNCNLVVRSFYDPVRIPKLLIWTTILCREHISFSVETRDKYMRFFCVSGNASHTLKILTFSCAFFTPSYFTDCFF